MRFPAAILALASFLNANEDKIAPRVLQQIRGGRPAPVIILSKTQMLDGPAAFPAFCNKHSSQKRTQLRDDVIARLKKIAATEQPKLRAALKLPDNVKSLWVFNAIATTLAPDQIRTAAKSDLVKYIHPAGPIPLGGLKGKVAAVLKDKRAPFSTEGKRIPWNLKKVKADQVWSELKITGNGVVVAMFDAGVNYRHADLRHNIWRNAKETPNNGKDDDKNGYVDDYYGFNFQNMTPAVMARGQRQHGTLTSGIVAGDGTGGIVTGVAPRAQLMPLIAWGGTYSAALAYQYAIENGADIVNMSFSIPNLGPTRGLWRLMAEQATCAGLVQVSGAGNFQRLPKPVQLRIPEGIPCVIAAGGVDQDLKVPNFVSLGPVEWGTVKFYEDHPMPKGLIKPDVSGFPGAGYPVLGPENMGYIDPNLRIRGNSFSGPHAAGAAALMLSANPELPAWQVKEILEQTATDLGSKGKDNDTGAGLINTLAAVREAIKRK